MARDLTKFILPRYVLLLGLVLFGCSSNPPAKNVNGAEMVDNNIPPQKEQPAPPPPSPTPTAVAPGTQAVQTPTINPQPPHPATVAAKQPGDQLKITISADGYTPIQQEVKVVRDGKGCNMLVVGEQRTKLCPVKNKGRNNRPTNNPSKVPKRVNLAKQEVQLMVPLPESKDTKLKIPTWFSCIPGVRYNNTVYWLTPKPKEQAKGRWVFPATADLENLDPNALLGVVSKRDATSKTPGQAACDNTEATLYHIKAIEISDSKQLRLPVARPVLIYVLRNQNHDAVIGGNNADLFWTDLLKLVKTSLANRVYAVRYKPDSTGFKSIHIINPTFPINDFDVTRIMRLSAATRSSAPLAQVAEDANQLIKDFGRTNTPYAADVIILGPTIRQDCEQPRQDLAALLATNTPNGNAGKANVVVLADSRDPELDLTNAKNNSIAYDCPKPLDNAKLAVHLTNAKESIARQLDVFPKDGWRKALEQMLTTETKP